MVTPTTDESGNEENASNRLPVCKTRWLGTQCNKGTCTRPHPAYCVDSGCTSYTVCGLWHVRKANKSEKPPRRTARGTASRKQTAASRGNGGNNNKKRNKPGNSSRGPGTPSNNLPAMTKQDLMGKLKDKELEVRDLQLAMARAECASYRDAAAKGARLFPPPTSVSASTVPAVTSAPAVSPAETTPLDTAAHSVHAQPSATYLVSVLKAMRDAMTAVEALVNTGGNPI